MAKATTKKQKLGPIQRKWLKALRSGKYKQTRRVLQDDDGFCCLGVACKILGLPENDFKYRSGKSTSINVMPGSSWRLLALYDDNGKAKNGCAEEGLADLNDAGMSFKRIATKIERDPSVYFKKPL